MNQFGEQTKRHQHHRKEISSQIVLQNLTFMGAYGLQIPFVSATCVHGGFPNSSSTLGPNLPSRLFLAPKKVSGWNVSKQDAEGHSCLAPRGHQPAPANLPWRARSAYTPGQKSIG